MNKNMKYIADNIMKLYLYADMCKMIHYSTDKMHEHKLADDVRDSIMKFADDLAEQAFGYTNQPKFKDFSLNHTIKKTNNIAKLVKNVLNIVESMRKEFEKYKMNGIVSLIDDFTGELSQFVYLARFDNVSNEKIKSTLNEVLKKYIK